MGSPHQDGDHKPGEREHKWPPGARGSPVKHLHKMAGVLLWVVSSFSIAQSTYKIASENRVTTEPTTTNKFHWFVDEELSSGKAKYDYKIVPDKGGKVTCDTAEKAVSNCNLLVRQNDKWASLSSQINFLLRNLRSVERRVLEVLGHLQEDRGTLHSRPERSPGAGAEAGTDLVCEAVHSRHLRGVGHSEKQASSSCSCFSSRTWG